MQPLCCVMCGTSKHALQLVKPLDLGHDHLLPDPGLERLVLSAGRADLFHPDCAVQLWIQVCFQMALQGVSFCWPRRSQSPVHAPLVFAHCAAP